jgi:hypothetical protein
VLLLLIGKFELWHFLYAKSGFCLQCPAFYRADIQAADSGNSLAVSRRLALLEVGTIYIHFHRSELSQA